MRICVDPGHGGYDSGAVAGDGTKEKDVALAYALELAKQLSGDHSVLLTRKQDDFVGLTLRANKANDWGAECFVSLHANAALNPVANGAWVIYDDDTTDGKILAQLVWRSMSKIQGLMDIDADEEVYPDNSPWVGNRELTVVSDTSMPAILVELGFLTNADDLAQLVKPQTRVTICRAIVAGLQEWGFMKRLYVPKGTVKIPAHDFYNELPIDKPIESAWKSPAPLMAAQYAGSKETAAELSLRVLRATIESEEAKQVLSTVKQTVMKIVLDWVEDLLVRLLTK